MNKIDLPRLIIGGPLAFVMSLLECFSKVVANKLKPLLPQIILDTQAAFHEGRWILENGIIVQELLHKMNRIRSRTGWVGMKFDMKKAFDRFEWNTLLEILDSLGTNPTFINLIKQCLSTASYSILLNGHQSSLSMDSIEVIHYLHIYLHLVPNFCLGLFTRRSEMALYTN